MILLNAKLRAFVAVAEMASVSGAAQELGLTQTATTKRIKLLESELGLALFIRSRTGMKLTSEGQALLRHCLEIRAQEGRLMSQLQKTGEEQEVDVTLTGSANMIAGRLVYQCQHIFKKWPKVNLRFVIEAAAHRLNHLKKGTADLAILHTYEVGNELDSKRLKPLEFVMVATAEWKGRSFRDIVENERLFAYHPAEPTVLEYLKMFGLLDQLRRPRLYANENQTLIAMLTMGLGFGLLPREIVGNRVEAGDLILLNQGRALKMEMALAWYPRRELPPYLKEIIQSIK